MHLDAPEWTSTRKKGMQPALNQLTYAIGDVHGRHDLLVLALEWIERHSGDQAAKGRAPWRLY